MHNRGEFRYASNKVAFVLADRDTIENIFCRILHRLDPPNLTEMVAESDGGPGPLGGNSLFSPVFFRLMPSHQGDEHTPQHFRLPHVSGAGGIQFL